MPRWAGRRAWFTLGDVLEQINAKLIRRHPHVFGEVQVRDAEHVVRNWEEIKRQERIDSGQDVEVESLLRGIPNTMPALAYAQELQKKALEGLALNGRKLRILWRRSLKRPARLGRPLSMAAKITLPKNWAISSSRWWVWPAGWR
jgi:uncharacterized protein YabN with tetrapyrrole methylase and pyrophosphatase domain